MFIAVDGVLAGIFAVADPSRLNKPGRTFTTQLDALKEHRNKGAQKVVVEHRHDHLAPGSQAVFDDVQAGGSNRKRWSIP